MERRAYTYYAFISYRHTDQKWAKWIQHALETYRFPVAIRSTRRGLPKKIFPIFRDSTDLAGGVLQQELKARLEESEFLIVLCSPESAKSEWVEQEVRYFQTLGRGAQIVPLIIDGEPSAQDPARECFCPALRNNPDGEMLGVSIPELGRRKAFLRVVATIMQLRYDELVRRDKRRTFHRRLAAGFAAALLAVASFDVYWYLAPHSHYYWSVTQRNNIPEGIAEISAEERKRASAFYKLVTQRGRVVRMEIINSLGTPASAPTYSTLDTYDCSYVEYSYADGELASATFLDAFGEPQMIERYDGLDAVNRVNPQNNSMIGNSELNDWDIPSAMGEINKTDPQISRSLIELDAQGFCIEERFMRDNLNNPACNSSGEYGYRVERGPHGETLCGTSLDRDGAPLYDDAACVTRMEYNDRGQVTSIANFDAQDRPVLYRGVHRSNITYDEFGNEVLWQYFDTEGNPCCNLDTGVCASQNTYDERGLLSEFAYFDERGEAAYSMADGVHRCVYQYDERGNLIQEDYYDADGMRMYNNSGVASTRYTYDALGRQVEERYYGIDGAPAFWAGEEPKNINQVVQEAGADQEPSYGYGTNSAGNRTEYPDDRTIRKVYLGADGKPALCYYGYAVLQRSYNADGLLERLDFLDAEGEPIRAMYNVASILYGYNGASRLNAVDYLDENGMPCANMFGAAQERIDYDGNGRPTGIRYCDAEGNPCWVKGSRQFFSQIQFELTDLGQISVKRYYDPDGKLLQDGSFAEERMQYDARGNQIRQSTHDVFGNLTNSSDSGIAIIESDYDSQGRLIRNRYLDEDGAPPADGTLQEEEWEYDARGNNVRYTYSYSDASGEQLQASEIYAYDARGNLLSIAYRNGEGEPVEINGVAAIEYSYDARNHLVREAQFNASGNYPSEGIAVWEYTFDARGKRVAEVDLGLESGSEELTCIMRWKDGFDQYGFQNEVQTLDSDGKWMPGSDGYAVWSAVFDAMGNCVQERWFDERGEPFALRQHYAMTRSVFDAMGNEIEETYYDGDGAPMTRESGCPARAQSTYNALGYQETLAYFDENGKPFETSISGYAKFVSAYDPGGIEVYSEMYGEDGEINSVNVRLVNAQLVLEDSIAAEAGLRGDDVIVAFDDWDILEFDGFRDVHLTDLHGVATESKRKSKRIVVCRLEEIEGGAAYCPLEFELGPGEDGIELRDATFDLYEAKCILEAYRTGQPVTLHPELFNSDYSDYQYERDGTF